MNALQACRIFSLGYLDGARFIQDLPVLYLAEEEHLKVRVALAAKLLAKTGHRRGTGVGCLSDVPAGQLGDTLRMAEEIIPNIRFPRGQGGGFFQVLNQRHGRSPQIYDSAIL